MRRSADAAARRLFARAAAENPGSSHRRTPTRRSGPGRRRSRRTACRATAGGRSTTTRSSTSCEKRLIAGNPTLAAALANYAQARALSDQARAGLFPTLGLNASVAARSRIGQRAAQGSHHADLLQCQHAGRQRQLRARPVGADSQRGRRGRGQRRRIRRGSRECPPVADRAAGRRLHSAAQPGSRQRDPRRDGEGLCARARASPSSATMPASRPASMSRRRRPSSMPHAPRRRRRSLSAR